MNRISPRTSLRPFLPSYSRNAVVHLIIVTGVCFVAFFFTAVCFQAFARYRYDRAVAEILPMVALSPAPLFLKKAWTLLTYGLFHLNFMSWLGNAIWIYVWGNVLQMLTGYRQIIPVFVAGNIAGGLLALLVQLLPGVGAPPYLLGAGAGIMALAAAAFVSAPNYRFWITPTFSLSIKLVGALFVLLSFFGAPSGAAGICWLAGGALAGVGIAFSLRKGYRFGDWIYESLGRISGKLAPAAPPPHQHRRDSVLHRSDKKTVVRSQDPQARLDALLEKIHAKGYHALSQEEKDFLKSAGENI